MINEYKIPRDKFSSLLFALSNYEQEDFGEAIKNLNDYNKSIRKIYSDIYSVTNISDVHTSIIIVYSEYNDIEEFYKCVRSVCKSNNDKLELIIVNNSVKLIDIKSLVSGFKTSIINLSCNILPSAARNIGSIVASGDWLYFIDDDAEVETECLETLKLNYKRRHAARGLIYPKDPKLTTPKHYNLGSNIVSSELNIEGNLLIRKTLFEAAGGFDPLMFAHEGKDLTRKCKSLVKNNEIIYDPKLIIYHNPSNYEEHSAKKVRNERSERYMAYKKSNNIDIIKCLAIVSVSEKDSFNNILKLIEQENEVSIHFLLLSEDTASILKKVKEYHLLHRVTVLPEAFSDFHIFDRLGYSLLLFMNVNASFNESDIKRASSDSLRYAIIKSISDQDAWITYLNLLNSSSPNELANKAMDMVEVSHNKDKILYKLDRPESPKYRERDDIIVISFYTTDEYYSEKANELKKELNWLGIQHDIQPINIPDNLAWPDICRKKVNYYYTLFSKHRKEFKKVVWIDVDCNLNYLPSFIHDFDVDFMAFRRGFPHSKHLEKNRTRHWEPCFFVFKSSSQVCYDMLKYASDLETEMPTLKATDDYFFEEAWRKFGSALSVFEIPGEMSSRGNKSQFNPVESRSHSVFFKFGDSGNVADYKGKVIQHSVAANTVSTKLIVQKDKKASLPTLINIARTDKKDIFDPVCTFGKGFTENERELVKSLTNYEFSENPILLNWWIRPAPGNMGDWLSPYILSKVAKRSVKYAPPPKAKVISLGSVGKFISDHHTAWGTGISARHTDMNKNARYLAVRGPYTAEAISLSGGTSPRVFGDPAILMPDLYQPRKIKGNDKKQYGLVRHFIHQNSDLTIDSDIRDINILLSSQNDIENFIDQLFACKAVVTTSLHVMILCLSYKIPCRLIDITEQEKSVHGDGIKYKDFYEGVGIKPKLHVDFGSIITKSSIESAVVDDDFIDRSLIDELRKVLLDDISNNPLSYI
ncbi:polysaccharide pyruvyl transferase family protein [Psychrobacter sp. JCM 18902]|uniref:polysaccharide pyruvyl transferase family protein n=1 Tax=Psychrobacter sp. JCM 18902 TaxID=1298607 RepID=UPI00191B3CBD|nr:polysaccharide pyruvyl transferase family protein [Psychrobacter sp. JCM 18902]